MNDVQHSLQTYLSDMLSLEEHVLVPFDAQLRDGDLPKYPAAGMLLQRMNDLCQTHVRSLRSALEAAGGHEAQGMKASVAGVEGWFASAIDKIRKTKIAKALRDDYTALSLCCVSYSMLLATANAYGAPQVAQLAQRHLQDYAQVLMSIAESMPAVVARDLQETGLAADDSTTTKSTAQIVEAWRTSAQQTHRETTGAAYPTV